MAGLKIEAFFSTPACPQSTAIIQLLNEIAEDYGQDVEIVTYEGPSEVFEKYHLTATPAVVVEGLIKMMGFCPSKESLVLALKEMGLE